MKLKYKGDGDEREILKSQFSSVSEDTGGPLDHDKVVWNEGNDFTADVSDKVGKWLLENYKGDFEAVNVPETRPER